MIRSGSLYPALFACCLLVEGLSVLGQEVPVISWRHLDVRDGLPEYFHTNAILQDRLGRVWIGYDRGLCVYDGYDLVHFGTTPDPNSIPEVNVQGLYEAPDGHIWISLRTKGIAVYDPVADKFTRLLPQSFGGSLPEERFWQLTAGENNVLWIGSERGLLEFNLQDSTSHLHRVEFDTTSVERNEFHNIIRDIVTDPRHPEKLLLGAGGLLEFDVSSKSFRHIPMPYSSMKEVGLTKPDYLILDLALPNDSTLWLATWAGGTMHYDLKKGKWNRIRNAEHKNQLYDDIGHRLMPWGSEIAWYAGQGGFGILNFRTGEYELYQNDPADVHSIRPNSAFNFLFTRDSTLIVCGLLGVSIASPYPGRRIELEEKSPLLVSVTVNGIQWRSDTSVTFLRRLDLNHNQNSVVFKVAVPVFYQPDSMRYRFRLEGYDKDWIETGTRSVGYHHLSGGNYVLRFQASRDGIVWTDGRIAPRIRIQILFWKRPLFIIMCILFLGGLAFIFHTMRIRQVRKEQRLKSEFNKKLASVEMSALRAQMNPHFMFNSLNSIKTYILKEKTEEASSYLTKFSQLMRSVLNNSKNVLVPLQDELKALRLYIELESLRFADEFTYTIDVEEQLQIDQLVIPPLLIQPYVENAIRHGLLEKESGQRLLHIKISGGNNDSLVVYIEDNGVGRSHRKKSSENGVSNRSYGMQITRDRIALIAETLGINTQVNIIDKHHPDGSAAGTIVEICIPKLTVSQMHALTDQLN